MNGRKWLVLLVAGAVLTFSCLVLIRAQKETEGPFVGDDVVSSGAGPTQGNTDDFAAENLDASTTQVVVAASVADDDALAAVGHKEPRVGESTMVDRVDRKVVLAQVDFPEWVALENANEPAPTTVTPVITETSNGYHIRIDIPGFTHMNRVEDGVVYDTIEIPGFSQQTRVGEPSVPMRNLMLKIPAGVRPVVQIASLSQMAVGMVNMWPAQPLPNDAVPELDPEPFQKEMDVYSTSAMYPASVIADTKTGAMRNTRILTVQVAPVQVNPVDQSALLADRIEIDIVFEQDAGDDETSAPLEYLPEGFMDGTPGKYAILLDDQFATNTTLLDFVDWKKRKGYDVQVIKTSDIDAGGAPSNSQIVAYMRALPAAEYPEYLLIIGDHTANNGVQGYYYSTYYGGWSDLYITCRDGIDYFPDLFCGRLPARDNDELTLMLSKAYEMDRSPPTEDYFQQICVAGQIQDYQDSYANEADRLFCETADSLACYFEQDAGGVDYDCVRAVVNPNNVTATCAWNWHHTPPSILWNGGDQIGSRIFDHFVSVSEARRRLFECLNRGIILLQHRDHGGITGWGDPNFQSADVRALTNGVKRPAVFSINCLTGSYHQDNNFTRAWLEHTNGGAYAVFSPTDVSYSWLNDWLTHGFYAAFLNDYITWHNAAVAPNWPKDLPLPGGAYGACGSAPRLGQILNYGKMYMAENYSQDETTFRLFHVFGDPESFLQLHTPTIPSVSHPPVVGVGMSDIEISTGEADAQVCLYSEALGIQRVTNTPASGVASLSIAPVETGTVYVTVTKQGRRPYEGTIEVSGSVLSFSRSAYPVMENGGSVLVTVQRSGDTSLLAQASYATVDGSATGGIDFTPVSGTLTFAPGVVAQSFSVPILNESVDELGEEFLLTLTILSSDTVFGPYSNAVVQIEDDDGAGEVLVGTNALTVAEDGGSVSVRAVRRNGLHGAVSVGYCTADGSAVAGQDYTHTAASVTFADGQRTNLFSIPIISDVNDEEAETFFVSLRNPSGGVVLGAQTNVAVTITDDDVAGELVFSSSLYAGYETNGFVTLTVERINGSDGPVSVDFQTRDGSAFAGSDYVATNGALTLGHQALSANIQIQIMDDMDEERSEVFDVLLSNPTGGASLGMPCTAQVMVVSDEAPRAAFPFFESFESGAMSNCWATYSSSSNGRIQVTGYNVPHSGSYHLTMDVHVSGTYSLNEAVLTVNLAGQDGVMLEFWHKEFSDEDETMPASFIGHYNADGVAVSADGTNWYKAQGLTYSDGISNAYKKFSVILDDVIAQHGLAYNADFQIKFQQYDNFSISTDGFAFDDIELKQNFGEMQFSSNQYIGTEGETLVLPVTRTNGSSHEVSIAYVVSNGSATAGSDFSLVSGMLTFPSGVTSNSISIPLISDGIPEGPEFFCLTLRQPSENAYVGLVSNAVVTIIDLEEPGIFECVTPESTCMETDGQHAITVVRREGSYGTAMVSYFMSDGTAISGEDYEAGFGLLSFAAGVTSQTVNVNLLDDSLEERPETFTFHLSNPTGSSRLGDVSNSVITIISDEVPHASLPFLEDFESGALSNYWQTYTSGSNGYAGVMSNYVPYAGLYHAVLGMTNYTSGGNLSELILTMDMREMQHVMLNFYHKEFNDEDHLMAASFVGHHNSDGVAISDDGITWHKLQGLTTADGITSVYRLFEVNVETNLQRLGLSRDNYVYLKFQQYDDTSLTIDGFAFDDISVFGEICDDLVVVPFADYSSGGYEHGPFAPGSFVYAVSNSGLSGVDWVVSSSASYLDFSTSGGSLAAGAALDVTASFNEAVTNVLPGEYDIVITFSNVMTAITRERHIALTVEALPDPPAVPYNPSPADLAQQVDLDADLSWCATQAVYATTGEMAGAQPIDTMVQVLAFVPYVDMYVGGEYDKTLEAISEHYTGFTVTNTTTLDPAVLSSQLLGKDVLLMPEQERWTLSGMSSFGTAAATVLSDFVARGGRMVVCDFTPFDGYPSLLRNAGLMNVNYLTSISSQIGTVTREHPITEGVAYNYYLANGSVCYAGSHDGIELVEQTSSGNPSVIYREYGQGDIVLIGSDFFSYNTDQARLIANCIESAKVGGMTYEVRFDTVNPPVAIAAEGHSFPFLEMDRLSRGTMYYWQVTASNMAGCVTGPVWRFTTMFVGDIHVTDSVAPFNDLSIPFGEVVVNSCRSETLTLANTNATHDLLVTNLSISGNGFSITNYPSLPITISPTTSVSLDVVYEPLSTGTDSGMITLCSTDEDEPVLEVSVSATAVEDYLHITPVSRFESRGHPGGPFEPAASVYTLWNASLSNLDWTAQSDAVWLQGSPTSGVLLPGQTQEVTFAVASSAASLPEGAYNATVVFSNHLTGLDHHLQATLDVYTSPNIVLTPASLYITNRVGQTMDRDIHIANTGDATLQFTLRARETGRERDDARDVDVRVSGNSLALDYSFQSPVYESMQGIRMDGMEQYQRTGLPILPVRPVTLLIPYGKKPGRIQVTPESTTLLDGACELPPAQPPVPLSADAIPASVAPDPAVYLSDADWPTVDYEVVGTQSKRGYQALVLNLFPVKYNPVSGAVSWAERMRVSVEWLDADSAQSVQPTRELVYRLAGSVDNPEALDTYPEQPVSSHEGLADLPAGGPYDYIIITTPELEAAPGPYNFQALQSAKNGRGVKTLIVTTNWIYANYPGTRPDGGTDNQTRIRNFLIDAYQTWGTRYVLLGATDPAVPARKFWCDPYAGSSYATEMPVDMYYGCLDPVACTFDYDADGVYGEPYDGVGGGDVDLCAELYVGRAAVGNTTELANFVRKTLTYEMQRGDYLPNVMMVGEYLGFGGVADYAKNAMEQIRAGGDYDGYFTYGFENNTQSHFYDFNTETNLYDADGTWAKSTLLAHMNQGVHIINHLGHANKTYDMKLYTSDLLSLTNTQYFFAYSQGCNPGWLDSANCFAEEITAMEYGAFAVVMNARYGWGSSYSTDGPSQRFDRQFWDAVLDENMLELGRANQDSKEDNLWDINGSCIRWCYYELNLFGDPELRLQVEDVCEWMIPEAEAGTVEVSSATNLTVTFDATDMGEGTYYGTIILSGNDVNHPVVSVPVCMYVLADDLMLTPALSFTGRAYEGGPFEPVEQQYHLHNAGAAPLNWTALCTQSWVDVTPSGGLLQPGQDVDVTARLNSLAAQLPPGLYHGTVAFSNVTSGYHAQRTAAAEVMALGVNMLDNGSFELQGTDTYQARSWQYNNPDTHGGKWGSASRRNWRHYPEYASGAWCGTICGSWFAGDTEGGWWQDAKLPVYPGRRYRFSGWFFADTTEPSGPWTADEQKMSLEFRADGPDVSAILSTVELDLTDINETWQYRYLEGVAPEGTRWVRCVIHASGIGEKAALQFDALRLEGVGAQARTLHVAKTGAHLFPYADWATAATNIHDAVAEANDGNTVLIDDGVYECSTPVLVMRNISIQSRNGLASTVVDGMDTSGCFRVHATEAAIDGLTLTHGNPQGDWPDNMGGAVFLNAGGILRNCLVYDNRSAMHGGGAACFNGGVITNCTFSDNTATYGGGGVYMFGGGLVSACTIMTNFAHDGAGIKCQNGLPAVYDCLVTENHGTGGGAGIDCPMTSGEFVNCRIQNNHGGWAGGMVFWNSWVDPYVTPVVENCIISGNYGSYGGGMICCGVNVRIRNSTIAFNTAANHAGGVTVYDGATPQVINSIVWGNSPAQFYGSGASVASACVQGGYPGTGIITADPVLNAGTCELQTGSSCIDAGVSDMDGVDAILSETQDITGIPRPLDGDDNGLPALDIGAHEFVHATADTDKDGLSDRVEIDTYPTSPLNPDCDNDGQLDGAEVIAGTSPLDASEFFGCEPDVQSGSGILRWQSQLDRRYTVQKRTSLSLPWDDVTGYIQISGTGAVMSCPVDPDGTEYYRVQVEMID